MSAMWPLASGTSRDTCHGDDSHGKAPVDLEQRVLDVALESAPPRRRGRSGLAKLNFLSANPVLALAAGVLLVAGAAGFWLRQDQGPMAAVVSSETVPVTSPAADIPRVLPTPFASPKRSLRAHRLRSRIALRDRARVKAFARAPPGGRCRTGDESRTARPEFRNCPAAAGPTRLAGDEVAAMNASSGLPPRLKVAAAPPAAVDEKSSPLPRSVGRDTNADLRTARQVRDSQGCAAALRSSTR